MRRGRARRPAPGGERSRTTVLEVARRLGRVFGLPRPFRATLRAAPQGRPNGRQRRHGSALEVLVHGVLSQNTSDVNSAHAFDSLMARFGGYDAIAGAPVSAIAASIRSGGLAQMKAPRLKRMLREIRDTVPNMDLDRFLAQMSDQEARRYLTSINGVGIKTASVVLLFAMGRKVFPVDTHVYRVSKRLGWIGAGVSREKAHVVLEPMIPPRHRYSVHINLIRHGRETCHPQRPECAACVLNDICPSAFLFDGEE